MKKLLMAAMVGLAAFAAQASYTYTWTMTIKQIPSSFTKLSDSAAWYLVDTSRGENGTVLCYNTSAEYGTIEISKDGTIKMANSVEHRDATVTLGGTVYKNDSHLVMQSDSSIENKLTGDTKSVKFQMSFQTETDLASLYGETANLKNLTAYLYDPDNVLDSKGGHTLTMNPVAYANSSGDAISFTSSTSMVPEPTSGLLVLFGLAGLALKRKRAA